MSHKFNLNVQYFTPHLSKMHLRPRAKLTLKIYLQVERLPRRPLSLRFNDGQYFISLQRERQRDIYKKSFVTKWMTVKGQKRNIDREKDKIDKLT